MEPEFTFPPAPNPLFAQPTQCARVSRELVVRVRLELVKPGAPLARLAVSEVSTQQLARRAGREIAPHQKDRSPPTRARRENRGPKSGRRTRRGRASSKSYLPLPSLSTLTSKVVERPTTRRPTGWQGKERRMELCAPGRPKRRESGGAQLVE